MNISKKIWLCVAYLTKFAIFVVIRGLCNDYIFSFSKFWPFFQCLCVCIIKTYKNLAISLPYNLTAWKWHYLSMRIIKYMYNYELVSTIYKFISYIIIHFYNHCENCQQLELLFFFFYTLSIQQARKIWQYTRHLIVSFPDAHFKTVKTILAAAPM